MNADKRKSSRLPLSRNAKRVKAKNRLPVLGISNALTIDNHSAVTRSIYYMVKNYRNLVNLKNLVTVSGMSRRGFIKAFNKHVGMPPVALMRQMRIESVKQLLVENDLPLSAVARLTGFRSENTLCIAFRRATGMPPKKFQRHAWLAASRTVGLFKLPPRPENKKNSSPSNQLFRNRSSTAIAFPSIKKIRSEGQKPEYPLAFNHYRAVERLRARP